MSFPGCSPRFGLPVTAVLTGANVYDNQVAFPMEKITERKVTHLYSLMDSAYDALPVRSLIVSRNRVPIIDYNKRRRPARELDPAEKQRFKVRTTVERTNAHLKDWLIAPAIYVKGPKKVMQRLMLGVVVLTALKTHQYIERPEFLRQAALSFFNIWLLTNGIPLFLTVIRNKLVLFLLSAMILLVPKDRPLPKIVKNSGC